MQVRSVGSLPYEQMQSPAGMSSHFCGINDGCDPLHAPTNHQLCKLLQMF